MLALSTSGTFTLPSLSLTSLTSPFPWILLLGLKTCMWGSLLFPPPFLDHPPQSFFSSYLVFFLTFLKRVPKSGCLNFLSFHFILHLLKSGLASQQPLKPSVNLFREWSHVTSQLPYAVYQFQFSCFQTFLLQLRHFAIYLPTRLQV